MTKLERKSYMAKWFDAHRERWNEYQRKWKRAWRAGMKERKASKAKK